MENYNHQKSCQYGPREILGKLSRMPSFPLGDTRCDERLPEYHQQIEVYHSLDQ
jgi:hypothetical protein